MKKYFIKLTHFWDEDRSLTVMMLLLLFFLFICIPVLSKGRTGVVFIKIVYSVLLLTGIWSVAKSKKFVVGITILAVASIFVNWLSEVDPSVPILIAHDLGIVIFNFFFAIAILVKTFQPGDITFHRIQGSIVVYLLLGMIFASAFHAVYLFAGAESFSNINGTDIKEFLYLSFTTLTTVGYGDISPVHPMARSLANFEALIGQLYPVILIARLVSMEFESSTRKREKGR